MKQVLPESKELVAPDDVVRLRAVLGKLSRRLRATKASAGLTPTKLSVLFEVVRAGSIGVGELAAREGINPTLLSRVIGQLCDAGLVRRETDPADRRSALVVSTAAGRRLRDRARSERNDALARLLAEASDADREAIVAALPALEGLAERLAVAGR
ncbi:MAG TPA: MarR family transcriptional regulator [Gaiellaceae bacterium]|nr:MarR family transcriptional regulator [Gaiellaceae bacterium]